MVRGKGFRTPVCGGAEAQEVTGIERPCEPGGAPVPVDDRVQQQKAEKDSVIAREDAERAADVDLACAVRVVAGVERMPAIRRPDSTKKTFTPVQPRVKSRVEYALTYLLACSS
jgi:hypothetical protein